jgi:hypothetical protein
MVVWASSRVQPGQLHHCSFFHAQMSSR